MGRKALSGGVLLVTLLFGYGVTAGDGGQLPRPVQLAKEAGDHYLREGRFADAVDLYLLALDYGHEAPAVHYNLGAALFQGYRAYALARHHFETYLRLYPRATDKDEVQALLRQLGERRLEPGEAEGWVLGGRPILRGKRGGVRPGEMVEAVAADGSEIVLVASYVYPDGVILCNRVYDPGLLEELGRKRYSPR